MDVISTTSRCTAVNRSGQPCGGWAVGDSEFCFAHDPDRAAERAAARAKGGRARHGRTIGVFGDGGTLTLATTAEVLDVVRQAIRDARTLENSIARARVLGYLAGVALKAFEVTDFEERIAALESVKG